jgi:hypothetical protein
VIVQDLRQDRAVDRAAAARVVADVEQTNGVLTRRRVANRRLGIDQAVLELRAVRDEIVLEFVGTAPR